MKTLRIKGEKSESLIVTGEKLKNLSSYADLSRCVIITDETVWNLYGDQFPDVPVFRTTPGEEFKTLATIESLYTHFIEAEVDRSSWILGIGGGIVCDITGFAASTFMRGVPFGFVASTLLAQVDASIGGKNGVNLFGYKNLAGTFNQPRFVLCDTDMLLTLPSREISCGFAEIIKHAAIASDRYFEFLESHREKLLSLDSESITEAVFESQVIKASIVSRDETEQGERKKLNFGHTLGHALEKVQKIPHGEAVSIGMAAAVELSVALAGLSEKNAERLKQLLSDFNLPITVTGDKKALVEAIGKDKKRESDVIHFVLLEDIGRSRIVPVKLNELEEAVGRM